MNFYQYSPSDCYFISIEEQPNYLFLFFLYIDDGCEYWKLTSRISRICQKSNKLVVTTKNSLYELSSDNCQYSQLSFSEFLLCRKGYAPSEIKLTSKRFMNDRKKRLEALNEAIASNRLENLPLNTQLIERMKLSIDNNEGIDHDQLIDEFVNYEKSEETK